jgi:aspartate aminotransferase
MLESFSYEDETVMMAPATGFYFTKGLGKKEVRIAYVLEAEKMKRAIFILGKGLEAYNSRT